MDFHELEFNQFGCIRPLFHNQSHLTFILEAAIAGNSPMRIWVDESDYPQSCFMWDKMYCYYFIGEAENDAFNKKIIDHFNQAIIPQVVSNNYDVYKIEYSTKEWEPFLEILLRERLPVKKARIFMTLNKFIIKNWRKKLPKHFEIRKIDQELLENRTLNTKSIIEEIKGGWDSIESFLKIGFGYCCVVHLDNCRKEVQGWCIGEYFSKEYCGIGIKTFRGYQKKGVATAMASVFVEHCLSKNIKPHWDSFVNNYASVRVAEKIGFKKIEDFNVYFGSFSKSELYKGYYFYSEKNYKLAAKWFEKAAELDQSETNSLYNAACSWSLAGEVNKAFLQLNKAIDSLKKPSVKFINYIKNDKDLRALQSNENWVEILTRLNEIESKIKSN
ncbi:MAG: GNAT family N-acetyltransferase [Candidatus Hodarchaeota archaeon]